MLIKIEANDKLTLIHIIIIIIIIIETFRQINSRRTVKLIIIASFIICTGES